MSNRTYADDLFPQELADQGEEISDDARSPAGAVSSVDAANARIHVGWMTTPFDPLDNIDRKVAPYCTKIGESKYTFVVFPVGGTIRAFWNRSEA